MTTKKKNRRKLRKAFSKYNRAKQRVSDRIDNGTITQDDFGIMFDSFFMVKWTFWKITKEFNRWSSVKCLSCDAPADIDFLRRIAYGREYKIR